MTVHAWRIVKPRFASAAFTGQGAKLAGGRWNSPGVAVVYTSESVALGMLELLVHIHSEEVLRRYVTIEVLFDDSLVKAVSLAALPRNWRKSPPPAALRRIGDEWSAAGESAVLRVPSVVVPSGWNFLLNPAHADFGKIAIGEPQPIRMDRRLG